MQAVRALYDGTRLRPLPMERLPVVETEIPVIVIFDEVANEEQPMLSQRREALERLRTARTLTLPLDNSLREMIEDGRDR